MPLFFADVPIVNLELGSKLQKSAIKEGDDVYMECNIKSHPWVTKVSWKHNVIHLLLFIFLIRLFVFITFLYKN